MAGYPTALDIAVAVVVGCAYAVGYLHGTEDERNVCKRLLKTFHQRLQAQLANLMGQTPTDPTEDPVEQFADETANAFAEQLLEKGHSQP